MTSHPSPDMVPAPGAALRPALPVWLNAMMPAATAAAVARHVGFLSGAYAAGVLIGAPLWGVVSDHVGRGRILIIGLLGYVASLRGAAGPVDKGSQANL